LQRLQGVDDADLVRVLYGDFVRQVFQGYRVAVTPLHATEGASTEPRLEERADLGGEARRAMLFDDLIVITGRPGSLGEEHLQWLRELKSGVLARLRALPAPPPAPLAPPPAPGRTPKRRRGLDDQTGP
jgi:hypothetical protein